MRPTGQGMDQDHGRLLVSLILFNLIPARRCFASYATFNHNAGVGMEMTGIGLNGMAREQSRGLRSREAAE